MESPDFVPSGVLQLKPNELEIISNPSLIADLGSTEVSKVTYGRLLSGKSINKVGLKNLFETLWQNKAGIQIEDYNEGIITLTCDSAAIKNRIMGGQPWQFAGSYLVLIEADAMKLITPELFQQIPFWVQVHGIPMGLLAKPMGERLGEEIANSMGEFMEFDPNYRRNFMRIRVQVNSSRPLLRGKILELNKNKDNIWVSFRYERLSKFCYFCGHLDHTQKDCAALMEEQESGNRVILQYDDSLKTVGLAYASSSKIAVIQRPNKNTMAQIALEAAQASTKISLKEPANKRMKLDISSNPISISVANINDVEGTVQNANKQKEAEDGDTNSTQYPSKKATKGMTATTPNHTLKFTSRGQKEPSVK